jgi:ribose transport system ATP-binding protein
VQNLTGNGVKNISFEARAGEVLGFAGLIGAGRTELMQLLFGDVRPESGSVELDGKPIRDKNPIAAIADGIALVPEDRKQHGVILNLSIFDNVTLPVLKRLSRGAVTDKKKEQQVVSEYMASLRIKAPTADQKVMNLSGGNQQKVVLAKWLATNPDVLIFDEPTRGIDIGAKQEIYAIMNDLAAQGKTILMVSSDMEELIGMSDRVIVLSQGRQMATLTKSEITQERILALSSGANTE